MRETSATEPAGSLPDGPWLDAVDLAHLASAHGGWAAPGMAFDEAADAFRTQGLARLASLAEGLAFDPEYFREVNPAWEGIDDLGCYRAWLLGAADIGRHPSPAAHLRALGLPCEIYPSSFPWSYYARRRPHAGGHRWAALDDFVATGGEHAGSDFPFPPDAAMLLADIARQRLGHDDATAIRLYERASGLRALPAADLQHLADAHLRQRSWRAAAGLYDAIIAAGHADGWTYRNRVHCTAERGDVETLLPALQQACIIQGTDPLWDGTVDLTAELAFNRRLRGVEAMLAADDRSGADRGLAERALLEAVEAVAAVYEALAMPPALPARREARVLLLADLTDPEAAERRAWERVRRFEDLDLPCQVVASSDSRRAYEALPTSRLFILFAVPAVPAVVKAVVMARRLGIPSCYETAESVAESATEQELAAWQERMGPAERDARFIAAALRRAAVRLCDFAVAPTARLAAGLRPLVRDHTALVVHDSYLPPVTQPPAVGGSPAPLVLCARRLMVLAPEPGSIGEPLLAALRRWPALRLRLCGSFQLDLRFDPCAAQIACHDEAGAAFAHWSVLAGCGLHLAWSDGTAAGDSAAETACAEAAALGVPSLLYAPEAADADPVDRIEALVVRDPAAWTEAVANFLAEPDAWAQLGEEAAGRVSRRHGTAAAAQELASVLAHAARSFV